MKKAVYIIELEQPWENWNGTLIVLGIKDCTIENEEGELVKVPTKCVLDSETMLPIFEALTKNDVINTLTQRGLSNEESEMFYTLLKKVKITDEDRELFEAETDQPIPFEGGMTFLESLIGMIEGF